MKQINYYLRDENNQPKTSVHVIEYQGNLSRGVSICSPCDQFVKADGREAAKQRAMKALDKKQSFGEIRREGLLVDETFNFRCEFNPELTEFEKDLMKDPESV